MGRPSAGRDGAAPDTVLDGEAVIYRDGRLDFCAVQSRAAAGPTRARLLADQRPAAYAAWDVLNAPDLGDVRLRPDRERRALLLQLLEPLGPPLQPVPATADLDVALQWYETLPAIGLEGIVAKRANGIYRPGRIWQKVRHVETVDAAVLGYTGAAGRPLALVVQLPDGSRKVSRQLPLPVRREVAAYLQHSPGEAARTGDGTEYLAVASGLVVEVEAGTTRHATVSVRRVRTLPPDAGT